MAESTTESGKAMKRRKARKPGLMVEAIRESGTTIICTARADTLTLMEQSGKEISTRINEFSVANSPGLVK